MHRVSPLGEETKCTNDSYKPQLLQVCAVDPQHGHHLGLVRNAGSLTQPRPPGGQGPAICGLTSLSGDSDTLSNLRSTSLKHNSSRPHLPNEQNFQFFPRVPLLKCYIFKTTQGCTCESAINYNNQFYIILHITIVTYNNSIKSVLCVPSFTYEKTERLSHLLEVS